MPGTFHGVTRFAPLANANLAEEVHMSVIEETLLFRAGERLHKERLTCCNCDAVIQDGYDPILPYDMVSNQELDGSWSDPTPCCQECLDNCSHSEPTE